MVKWTPNFSWVQPDLALGGSFPAEQAARLACDHQLGAVVDLRSEASDDAETLAACGLRFLHLPTPDRIGVDQPMLDLGVAFAAKAAHEGRRLLIHCEHGIGRSATLALCVLVDRGLQPMAALQLAKDARALVSPSESQHEAWVRWLGRKFPSLAAPTYHEFGVVAYRHLGQSA